MSVQHSKKAADEGAKLTRDTMREGSAKAEQSMARAQEGLEVAGDSAQQMNLTLLGILRTNTEAFFEFVEDMATAKDPGKLFEIWTKHTQKQMELLSKHSQELTSLGQRLGTANMESFSARMR